MIKAGLFVCLLIVAASTAAAAELTPATIAAFNQYSSAREERLAKRLGPGATFLWVDESPDRKTRVRGGQILVRPAAENGQVRVKGGLVHDWFGAMFIPGVTLKDVLDVLHDYDQYKDFYRPGIVASRALSRNGDVYTFMMRLRRTEFVEVVLDSEYESRDTYLDSGCFGRSRSTRIQEVRNAGRADEHKLLPGNDRGLLWRLNGYTRLLERDGGVYLELESLALTRSVPAMLAWFIEPLIGRVSRESMSDALRMTRDAVLRRARKK